ncbi:hypothetical protein [Agrobacterium sp. V1]|uniref:hypothetical protein n=1 Tax=Agrobacterium sp. V1 TaxID=3061957 RepID=UPI0026717FC8|nr:hypothetical protein [Agrobacterium sp. V1]MDO3445701.1 hypothetical protein [Agrobacterium sp. V1]
MGDNVELLMAAGKALYGKRWQSPVGRDLETTDRTVRNWLARAHPIPEHVPVRLEVLLRKRKIEIDAVLEQIGPGIEESSSE